MDNKNIATKLAEIGDILEIKGEDKFRVNAYHNAAIGVFNYPKDIRDLIDSNPAEIERIPGVGKNIKSHIIELLTEGKCKEFEDIRKSIPDGLLDMLRIRGIGPKKVKLFYSELKIHSIQALKEAAEKGILATLPGMGEKSQKEILGAIDEQSKFQLDRVLIDEALMEAEKYIEYMRKCKEIKRIEYAGSLRRRQETIGDIDLLATTTCDSKEVTEKIMEYFVKYKEVVKVLASGETKSAVVLDSGIQVDLRVVPNNVYGAALQYFTGNKNHNILIRDMAKKKGLKVSEYGVFKRGKEKKEGKKKEEKLPEGKLLACHTEEDVFKALSLPYIEPELRNGEDEIKFALEIVKAGKKMPKLIELKDLKGDLHVHSVWSDGGESIETMAEAYREKGFEYMAMTDHSPIVGVAGGMDKNRIKKQWIEIDKINKKFKDFRIFKGCEVDILKDGTLDFDEEILKNLDIVVISAHMYAKLTKEEQTKRLIRAIENPYSEILGHPTGRMINRRAPMEFDMIKVIDACKVNKVAIEINSNPLRLDLADKYVKIAKEMKVKIAINSDAHDVSQIGLLKYGVFVGRRGWLTKNDVLNTLNLEQFLRFWEE